MLTASKELGIIKRKRKKSFREFDPKIDKEETKGRSKDQSLMMILKIKE